MAAAVLAVAARDWNAGGDRAEPPRVPGAAERTDRDGPSRVFTPTSGGRTPLRFDLAALERTTIVAAWLRNGGERRRLSVSAVSRAAGAGALSIQPPKGWAPQSTQLVVRTASRDGVYGCGFGRFRAGAWPPGCWRPYAATSPFNQRLPAEPRVALNSDRVVARLLEFGPIKHLEAGLADRPGDFARPTYYSRPGDPVFTLHCYERSWGTCEIEGHRIRIPDAARPAAGFDRHLTVVDQDLGWEYDLYKVRTKPRGGGRLELRWGGRTRIDGLGLGSHATAAHYGNLAGVIRAAELEEGRIDHALFVTAHCDSGQYVYPARQSGRSCASLREPSRNAPAMGARLQLAMSPLQIDALRVPGWKKIVLRAMATYGMFVGDTGGGTWGPLVESGSTFTSFGFPDPLVRFARRNDWTRYGDLWVGNLRNDVDWARHLRVIDPCVSQETC